MSRKYISSIQLGKWITEIRDIPSDKAKERFAEIYQTLYADTKDGDGFGYAGWGKGVVTKETITGVSAVNFMNAQFSKDSLLPLTEAQEIEINRDMLSGYLTKLQGYADKSGGQTNKEVTYDDLYDFHEQAFLDNGLKIEKHWTLYVPMKVLEKQYEQAYKKAAENNFAPTDGLTLTEQIDLIKMSTYKTSEDYVDAMIEKRWQAIAKTGGQGKEPIGALFNPNNGLYQSSQLADAVEDFIDDKNNKTLYFTLYEQAEQWQKDNGLEGSMLGGDYETYIRNLKTAQTNIVNHHYENDNYDGESEIYVEKRKEMIKAFLDRAQLKDAKNEHSYHDYETGDYLISTDTDYSVGNNGLKTTKSEVIFGSNKSDKNEVLKSHDWGNKEDFIFGRDGDDTLIGGAGKDHLEGGKGDDIYHIEDNDTIYDTDMKGHLVFDDIVLKNMAFVFNDDKKDWYSVDKRFHLTRDNNNLLVADTKNPNDKVVIRDFFKLATHSDDIYSGLGITLGNLDSQWTKTNTNQHTLSITRPDIIHLTNSSDVNHEIITHSGNDLLFGAGARRVNAKLGEGDDLAYGSLGKDALLGELGNDVLYGSNLVIDRENPDKYKNDTDELMGGEGIDLLTGVAGDDILVGDTLADINSQESIDAIGNWLVGDLGDDQLFGGRRNDFINGGAGGDFVNGGAGNDVILGDGQMMFNVKRKTFVHTTDVPDYYAPTRDWWYKGNGEWQIKAGFATWKFLPKTFEFSADVDKTTGEFVFHSEVAPKESIHRVEKGGASDTLYGGAGDDVILGQVGDDYLFGNSGDDILWGDDFKDKDNAAISGNDYLDGGDDNDTLYGGLGDDTLIGGKGKDTLNGGDGHDYYHLSSKDDNTDTINDTDDKGEILIDDISLKDTLWNAVANNNGKENTFEYNNYQVKLEGSDLSIINEKGKAIGVIKDFDNEDLGITLNHAPIANGSLAEQTLLKDKEWSYTLSNNSFTDKDDDKLVYSIKMTDGSPTPAWLQIDSETGELSGTPTGSGKLSVTVIATDKGGLQAEHSLTLDIKEKINHAPELQSEFADVSVTENQAFTTQLDLSHFTDSDGDKLNYHITQADNSALPSWLHFDKTTGILSGTPTDDQDISLKITATDTDGLSVSDEFVLDVKAQPIVAKANWNGGTVNGGSGDDHLSGSWFTDTINGNDGDDVLSAGLGNDIINGGNGNDTINGGFGNNTLIGGKGNDTLTAGLGADTYQFRAGDGQDTITDKGGLLDKLVLMDLSLDDLLLDTDGDDWIISVKDSDDQITITNANHWAKGRIETFELGNQTMSYREFEKALSNELDNPYMLVA